MATSTVKQEFGIALLRSRNKEPEPRCHEVRLARMKHLSVRGAKALEAGSEAEMLRCALRETHATAYEESLENPLSEFAPEQEPFREVLSVSKTAERRATGRAFEWTNAALAKPGRTVGRF